MSMANAQTKQQAHDLIERIAPSQVAAVVGLMETMPDPVAWAIANAPVDDEPETEGEREAVVASKAWAARHPGEGISSERLLAEIRYASGAGAVSSKPEWSHLHESGSG